MWILFLIIVNVAVLLFFIGVLIYMQKTHKSFTKRVFTGLGVGIILGALLQYIYGADSEVLAKTVDWYSVVGSGYIRFLMMIVVPLVMVSIIQSIINMEKSKDLGKISVWIIGFLISTAMVAALIGIGTSTLFNLDAEQIETGDAEQERGVMMEETLTEVEDTSAPQKNTQFYSSKYFS